MLDDQVKANYEKGAAVFGHGVMQIYTGMGNKHRFHDSLQAIEGIIHLHQKSGLNVRDFGGRILAQVGIDEGSYGERRHSWHYMNQITQELAGSDLVAVLEKGKVHSEIEEIASQVQVFESVSDIFASWKSLKQFYELAQTLKNAQLLHKLTELKEAGKADPAKAALYTYGTTLGFHPGISLQDALTFMNHPQAFLEKGARFTDYNVHQRLSPGRYTRMPHLDLTAENMRDALVSGELEEMQSFPPMEMEFSIPINPEYARLNALSVANLIKEAAGSYRDNIRGKARQPGQILGEVGRVLAEGGRSGKQKTLAIQLVQGKLDPAIDSQEEEAIKERILFTKMGFGFDKGRDDKVEEFKAMVTQKSDPLGVVAGNDMANCMPFGDGKTTQYTYSPASNFFLVQRKNAEGQWRTVSQALLTENKQVSPSSSSIDLKVAENKPSVTLSGVKAKVLGNKRLDETFDESLLDQNNPSVINADSIEVANNFIATQAGMRRESDDNNIKNLQRVYSEFFSVYLPAIKRRAAESGRIIDEKRLITTANHQFNPFDGLKQVPNDSAPITTLSYLDNNLAIAEQIPVNPTQVETVEVRKKSQQIEPLTWRDSLQVAWIQERAYAQNPSLDLGIAEMQNSLIAQAINNKHKGRPNMSLKYTDSEGMMRGYLNAYEGRFTSNRAEALPNGSPVIYIEDLARDPGNDLAGGKLILKFLELYRQNYIETSNAIPIYGEFRDQTSYQIIEKSLGRMAKRLGKTVRREDLGAYRHGQDTMHRIAFFVE